MAYLILEGSARPDSRTGLVARHLAGALEETAGQAVQRLQPGSHLDALMDGTVAGGPVEAFRPVVERVGAAEGVILVTPEYHGSYSAVVKLVLDNLGYPSVLRGKPVGVVALGAARFAGTRAADALLSVLAHIRARPFGRYLFFPAIQEQLSEAGDLHNPELQAEVADYIAEFHHFCSCTHEAERRSVS
ncbi:NADPH-dependent FMN reductase [Thiohalorhabdus sp. Cl-TMA]|uniref:NADPH-dependent FMN reductase n=1 Tax=Thiohalorhabdus methylotrophus TaxID=3242694 RepID=A0ABV4TYW9_9GAMM